VSQGTPAGSAHDLSHKIHRQADMYLEKQKKKEKF
jgi:hypothetical protein